MKTSNQILDEQGIVVDKDTTFVPSSTAAFGAFLETRRGFESKSKNNHESLSNLVTGDGYYSDEWCGGSPKDVEEASEGRFETAPFLAAREEFQSKLANVLDAEAFVARKRSRFLSEHDGDWDRDRQFEREPFSATRITNGGVSRTVDIVVNFCFSCGVSAKDIARYGAVAWSVADFLERAGFQVSISLKYHTTRNYESKFRSDGVPSTTRVQIVKLKEAGQYMDTLDLARCFTAWFFRRVFFSLAKLSADSQGANACGSLGFPVATVSKAEQGKIELGNEIMNYGAPDMDKIAAFIKAAVAK